MATGQLPWWEREKLLTKKDREAIQKAIYARWEDIDESTAETDAGREEIHRIRMRMMHNAEFSAEML